MNNNGRKFLFVLIIMVMLALAVSANKIPLDNGNAQNDNRTNHGKVLLENNRFGSVKFLEDLKSDLPLNRIRDNIVLEQNKVTIDTQKYPELNLKATIIFENVNIKNPILTRNGLWRKEVPLWKINNSRYQAIVPGFSEWELVENQWNGTFYNTTIDSGNLVLEGDAETIFDFTEQNTTDKSVNNYTILVNNGDFTTDSITGDGSYHFNLSEAGKYVEVSNTQVNLTNKNFTVGVAFKTDNGNTGNRYISGMGSAASFDTSFSYWLSAGSSLRVPIANNDCSGWLITTELSYNAINVGQWYQVWFTKVNNNVTLYVDGAQVDNQLLASNLICDSTNELTIGSGQAGLGRINGTVDYFNLFERALTKEEIVRLNNSYINSKYKKSGSYISIKHNVTDSQITAVSNNWKNISFQGNTTNMSVYGRSGDCAQLLNKNWTIATKNSNTYLFNPSLSGLCFDFNATFQSDGRYTARLFNYTINSESILEIPEICDDDLTEPNTKCAIFTTVSSCNTYVIKNITQDLENGSLINVANGIKYLEFNQSIPGEYIIDFCGGFSQNINVVEDNENMILATVLGIMFISGLFAFLAFRIDKEHSMLKFLMMFLSLGMAILIPNALINGYQASQDTLFKYSIIMMRVFIVYFFLYMIYKFLQGSTKFQKWLERKKLR